MRLFVAVLIPLLLAACSHPTLTEQDVEEFIARMDTAWDARNADAMADLVSNAAQISVTAYRNGKAEKLTLSKADYIKYMKAAWASVSDYHYTRNNVKIEVHGNTATFTDDLIETMTLQGQVATAVDKESYQLTLDHGKLLLLRADDESSM